MIQFSDAMWKIHKDMTPLTLMCGTWIYDTWWKRFRGFLATGKWPKEEYIPGLSDIDSGIEPRINWLDEPE